jgi:hypothetical protein
MSYILLVLAPPLVFSIFPPSASHTPPRRRLVRFRPHRLRALHRMSRRRPSRHRPSRRRPRISCAARRATARVPSTPPSAPPPPFSPVHAAALHCPSTTRTLLHRLRITAPPPPPLRRPHATVPPRSCLSQCRDGT